MATRVALITGAARRLGKATALALHQRGLNILLHYRRSETDARALADEMNALRPDSVQLLKADLDDPDAVRALACEALAPWGRVDVLVNNASSFYATPLETASDDDWVNLVHSNLRAPFILMQSLAATLREHHGSVVNLIDVYAQKPLFEHSLYCAAKAGLASLTLSMARELAPNVRVNGVAPGPILWPEQGQDNQSDIIAATALKRTGQPDDIAGAVTWLALDAPFVTGQILAVDGGRSLAMTGG